ncbi:glycosyltransferase family 39 protein [Helicobacter fennelliae]|uniref:glycosyltransferase family 39 protein n=1 Tax=Helicobacter fennelliae TaxID=215 RepID=UPI001B341B30|nr:glycosyltransferase family 39 protein [Helicobacter fennelliae]
MRIFDYKDSQESRILFVFLLCHFVVWSFLPFMRGVIPLDCVEALSWGKNFVFGTDKHPPLSGWLAYYFYVLCFKLPESVYILSQIFVVLGLVYIYKIAQFFLSYKYALFATIILDTIIYYNFTSIEYNVNVVLLFLCPAFTYYFYKAFFGGLLRYWILTAIFAALGVLDKYYMFLILACAFLAMCMLPTGRKAFGKKEFYIGVVVFIVLLTPHILWMFDNDFMAISYILNRGGLQGISSVNTDGFLVKHIGYPIYFFLSQFILVIPALYIFFITRYKSLASAEQNFLHSKYHLIPPPHNDIKVYSTPEEQKYFLIIMAFGPIALLMFISFISGIFLLPMWGTPLFFMFGIWLFYTFWIPDEIFKQRFFAIFVVVIHCLYIIAFIIMMLFTTSLRKNLDSEAFIFQVKDIWSAYMYDTPLLFTGGDMWLSSIIAIYFEAESKNKIKTFIDIDPKKNSWVDEKVLQEIKQKGILIVSGSPKELQSYADVFPHLQFVKEIKISSSNILHQKKEQSVFVGIAKDP